MNLKRFFQKLMIWRIKHISNKNFLFVLSIIVGILGGLTGVVLKLGTHYIENTLKVINDNFTRNYLLYAYPLIGLLITETYRKTLNLNSFQYGVSSILYAISKKSGIIPRQKMHSHIASAWITVGFGGSVGLEAPIVVTGAAIGSNIARWMHFDIKKRILLLGCGVAAGISSIFNAPIAGVIFCIEVLMLELSVPAFIPLLFASVTGNLVARFITGESIVFNLDSIDSFNYLDLPFYAVIGAMCGLVSIYFVRVYSKFHKKLIKVENNYKRVLIGGGILSILIIFMPQLYGEAFEFILKLINNQYNYYQNPLPINLGIDNYVFVSLFLLLVVLLIKPIASALTIAAGGAGGIFAPSIFTGAIVGYSFAIFINSLNLGIEISVKNSTLIGMAGVLGGVLHAPLTAVFLLAEITQGYELMVPLMLVVAISYLTSSYFESNSAYVKQQIAMGLIPNQDRDRRLLTELNINKLIEREILTVNEDGYLSDVIKAVSLSNRNIFIVVDEKNKMKGVILLDNIRPVMFKPELYNKIKVKEIMNQPEGFIRQCDNMEEAMSVFDKTGVWNLPVLDNDDVFVGILSKSKILTSYRNILKRHSKQEIEIIE